MPLFSIVSPEFRSIVSPEFGVPGIPANEAATGSYYTVRAGDASTGSAQVALQSVAQGLWGDSNNYGDGTLHSGS